MTTCLRFVFILLMISVIPKNVFAAAAVQAQKAKASRQQLKSQDVLLKTPQGQQLLQQQQLYKHQQFLERKKFMEEQEKLRSRSNAPKQSKPEPQQNEAEETIYDEPQVLTSSGKRTAPLGPTRHVEEGDVFGTFNQSSMLWYKVVNPDDKVYIISHYVEVYRQRGVRIQKPATYYAQIIDDMARSNPGLFANSFDKVLQIVAVMDYDFDNGQNKDAMAMQILGQQNYLTNKQRLGIQ